MKKVVQHETQGEIVFEESFWTGKKKLSMNGVPLTKTGKNVFTSESGEQYILEGNYLTGSKLAIGNETIVLSPSVKWYEIVLSVIPFLLILIWGNAVPLCKIVPVVGGAIGGAIGAVFSVANLLVIKGVKQIWLKVIISVAFIGITFAICCGIGYAIVESMS